MTIILHQTIFLGLTVLAAAFSQTHNNQTNGLAQTYNLTYNQPNYKISVDEWQLSTRTSPVPRNAPLMNTNAEEMSRLYDNLQTTVERISTAAKEEIDVDNAIDVVDKAIDSLISVRAELRGRRGRRTVVRTQISSVPVSNTGSVSGGDITSTPSSANQTNLSRFLTSQIQNTNFSLGVIEQNLENIRRNNEERHRQQEEFYKRHHQGNLRDLEQRKNNESLLTGQRMNETGFIRYQNELSSINEQTELGRRETESQMEYIQRMDAEAELRHQNFLKKVELERQRKEREKERKRCAGLRKLNPHCW